MKKDFNEGSAISQKEAKYKPADANPFSLNVSLHKILSRAGLTVN